MKWGLATITFSQMTLPVEQISAQSNTALMCTGILWTRWSMIIVPANPLLASCNAFLAAGGIPQSNETTNGLAATQLGRLYLHDRAQKKAITTTEASVGT
jgi:hypothetical protein